MRRLDNVIAIITGAAGGIGAAIARRFVAEGASVALADREAGPLEDLAATLGPRAIAVPTGVSDEAATRALVAAAADRFGGLDGLVKTAAVELGPLGICVNAISLGPIDNRAAEVKAGYDRLVPLGRYGTSEEIVSAAAFLASADGAYCNGTTIVCDGGFVAQ